MITIGLYGIADTTSGRGPNYTHDHSVAFMRDGRVLTVVQLERWTGRKFDNRLPQFIGEILARLLPPDEDVRFVSVNTFVGSSFASADGNLRIEPRGEVAISADLVPADVHWFPDGLNRRPAEGWVLCHEAAHLGSLLPFVGSFDDGAFAAHIDGGASRSACSFWGVDGGVPQLRESSWDLLKDVVNNFNVSPAVRTILGFEPADHLALPGRLMGYAGLGEADDDLDAWLRSRGWLLGQEDAAVRELLLDKLGTIELEAKPCQDLAATIQRAFLRQVTRELTSRAPSGGTLYLAGGAALNIPTNAALLDHFDEVWVPPGTNDGGLGLGAAAWVEYLEHGPLPRQEPFLNRFDVPCEEPEPSAVDAVVDRLVAKEVVGVCNGAGELGPRALGHRSILARADDADLRVRVSEVIKRREWYRPVAPVLCAEAAVEVLGARAAGSSLSRWMLGAWPVAPAWRDHLRGVLHLDGSVRAQVVPEDGENAWLAELLRTLWRRHGIPALINTSFNGPGRPIVQRHEDAVPEARRLGLDSVVVHGSLHRP